MNEGAYEQAREALTALLAETGAGGSPPLEQLVCGALGECLFQLNRAPMAIPPTLRALQLSHERRDMPGVALYLGNLHEIHRFLGQEEAAATHAQQLADLYAATSQPAQSRFYRRRAAAARHGEPLNRVMAVLNGERLELDEVPSAARGQVQFVFERNRLPLRPATLLIERGDAASRSGRLDEALDLFREAGRHDPHEPHCRYLEGNTLLFLGRPAEAQMALRITEQLAPSWFDCRIDLWLAEQLVERKLDNDSFIMMRSVEGPNGTPAERLERLRPIAQQYPRQAYVMLLAGKLLLESGEPRAAEQRFREALGETDNDAMRTRALVHVAYLTGDPGERRGLLEEALALRGHFVAAAMAQLGLRSDLTTA